MSAGRGRKLTLSSDSSALSAVMDRVSALIAKTSGGDVTAGAHLNGIKNLLGKSSGYALAPVPTDDNTIRIFIMPSNRLLALLKDAEAACKS